MILASVIYTCIYTVKSLESVTLNDCYQSGTDMWNIFIYNMCEYIKWSDSDNINVNIFILNLIKGQHSGHVSLTTLKCVGGVSPLNHPCSMCEYVLSV